MKIRIKNYFVIVAALFVLSACNQSPIRIACVGDSITEGAGIKFQNVNAYPAYLDSLLGDDYCVLNSGKGGTTLQSEGDFSYWNTKEFSNMFNFEPDIVILKLGTNDTKPQNWNEERFSADYQLLIDTILTMKNRPEIIICKPVPVFATRWGINDSILVNGVIPTIEKIALKNNLKLIDLNTPFKNDNDLFPDDIHPNEHGTLKMAEIIANFIHNVK